MSQIRVTQRRSTIGCSKDQIRTVRALGLRKIGHSVLHDDNPSIRGMVFKVQHLVQVAPAEESEGR